VVNHNNGNSGTVWVANEDFNQVLIFDGETGNITATLSVQHPLSLLFSPEFNCVFVSSKSSGSRGLAGAVLAIDAQPPYSILHTYALIRMDHPSGLAVYKDSLIVADQKTNSIYLKSN
jgi:DNA-binding beta-propeller fold protein YncE